MPNGVLRDLYKNTQEIATEVETKGVFEVTIELNL